MISYEHDIIVKNDFAACETALSDVKHFVAASGLS